MDRIAALKLYLTRGWLIAAEWNAPAILTVGCGGCFTRQKAHLCCEGHENGSESVCVLDAAKTWSLLRRSGVSFT